MQYKADDIREALEASMRPARRTGISTRLKNGHLWVRVPGGVFIHGGNMVRFGLWGISTMLLVIGLLLVSILTRMGGEVPVTPVVPIVAVAMLVFGYIKVLVGVLTPDY